MINQTDIEYLIRMGRCHDSMFEMDYYSSALMPSVTIKGLSDQGPSFLTDQASSAEDKARNACKVIYAVSEWLNLNLNIK